MFSRLCVASSRSLLSLSSRSSALRASVSVSASASASPSSTALKLRTNFNHTIKANNFSSLPSAPAIATVRKQAPAFIADALAADGSFSKISFPLDYKGKYVVLFFYPLDFTFVCPTEIIEFSDRAKEFRAIGAELVGASTDSLFSHHAWSLVPRSSGGVGKLDIPLVSDISHKIAKQYQVFDDEASHSLRGTFIIDGNGVLRYSSVGDFPVGRSVDEVKRLVQAFQFTDKHGEVCPANWKKEGDATIIDNPKDKVKYFEKQHKA